jgi:membrane protein DedA with SNARE-associated domain
VESVALFLLPFLHEDMAIFAAALLVAERRLVLGLAAASLGAGMIGRDFLLYGLGVAARRSSPARRLLIGLRVKRLAHWLRGNMTRVVLVSRLVPGLMFPAYIACGWFALPFPRFALTSVAITAVYLPVVLGIALVFGNAAIDHVGGWA